MRILLNVKIPHQPFNAAVKDGTAGSKLSRILEAIKPEAVYFTEQNGQRGAVLIVDLPDPSKIPALAEPWFLTFQADVEFRVVMSPDDLKQAGLDDLGKKWSLICQHFVRRLTPHWSQQPPFFYVAERRGNS
jgi:hypothetical protein